MRARLGGSVVAVLVLVGCMAAPTASAKLRSPRLSSSCPSGFAYAETVIVGWRVEGCSKTTATQSVTESSRRVYDGPVEVNGMLIEGANNLVATTGSDILHPSGRLQRTAGRIVVDPLIDGARRKFTIYTGDINLRTFADSSVARDVGVPREEVQAAAAADTVNTIDIPVGADATILGLRLRHDIMGAKVKLGSSSSGSGIEFSPKMSLGATTSDLLKNWTAHVDMELVDGTGMKISGLRFEVPDIEIPGTGGFHDLDITYSAARDEWSGGVVVDFGDLFPTIDFDMSVDASTGAPTSIAAEVSNLNIPLGPTGIVLDAVRASFITDPLTFGAGVSVAAGPVIAGNALIEISGDLEIALEPNFRLDARGSARVLPVGGSELARGDMHVIMDSDGYLFIGGDARYELTFLDIGVSANIGGSGAYSTNGNRFNIEAHANGNLELGFLGSFTIVQLQAVVSSNGWGTCGQLAFFITAGVGQRWDDNPKVLFSCDLGQFSANVSAARIAQNGVRARTFKVARGTKQLTVELTADAPELPARLVGPGGNVRAATIPLGRRLVDANTAVIAQPGATRQLIGLRSPTPGTWTVQWAGTGPQLTSLRTARDVPPVSAQVSIERRRGDRPNRRRLRLRNLKGLLANERVVLGVQTKAGVVPLGDVKGPTTDIAFDDLGFGKRKIVAMVLRDGIPNPLRTRTLGTYTATQPPPPGAVSATRRRSVLMLSAQARRGAELPDRWQYVVRSGTERLLIRRGRPGQRVRAVLPPGTGTVLVTVRPVVGGRVLRGPATTRIVRR